MVVVDRVAELRGVLDRLRPGVVGAAIEQNPDAIDIEAMEAIENIGDGVVILPAHQEKGGGAVDEAVFAGALPNEVPGVVGIDAKDAPTLGADRGEVAVESGVGAARLVVAEGIRVGAGLGRHKADAEDRAIGGIAEALNGGLVGVRRGAAGRTRGRGGGAWGVARVNVPVKDASVKGLKFCSGLAGTSSLISR